MNNLSTSLPFPILRHILLTADPVSLFKLAETHPFLHLYSFKLRGLPIDTLIITPSNSPFSFSSLRKSTHPKPFLYTSPITGATEVRLKCTVTQLKNLHIFERVSIWKNVILKHLTDEIYDGIKKLNIENGCNLMVKNCELSPKTWKTLLKLKWNGFECDSKQPPIECITSNCLNLENISISLYSAFYDEVELICQWKQKKYFKHVKFHHLFAGLYPKLIAEFIEEKLDSDSSIEIIYHPEITKIEIDFFQKSLIKWMNKVSADWAMVGHYGPKKKLLIKLGNGSGDKKFDEKFMKYINQQKKKSMKTRKSPKNWLTKIMDTARNPMKKIAF